MPTANLQGNEAIHKKVLDLPNGIYITKFRFLSLDRKWKSKKTETSNNEEFTAVTSVGTNPHYENLVNSRCIESYVVNDFGSDTFYGE